MKLTQSLTGLAANLRSMADELNLRAEDGLAGMSGAEEFVLTHQPRLQAHTVETLVKNLKLLRDAPERHAEFFELYVFED